MLAVNGGEAITNTVTSNQIIFNDAANSASRARLAVADTLTMRAVNNDNYDSKIEASAIGAAAVTGGLAGGSGVANVGITIGEYAEIDAHNINMLSDNRLSKTGYNDENFTFAGGGGLTVTLGYAEATQAQNSIIHFKENSDVYVVGNGVSEGDAGIIASSLNKMDTGAKLARAVLYPFLNLWHETRQQIIQI